jgi:hypothetical protein
MIGYFVPCLSVSAGCVMEVHFVFGNIDVVLESSRTTLR